MTPDVTRPGSEVASHSWPQYNDAVFQRVYLRSKSWAFLSGAGVVLVLAGCGNGSHLVTTAQLQRAFFAHGLHTRIIFDCAKRKHRAPRCVASALGAPHAVGSIVLPQQSGSATISVVVQAWILDSVQAADKFDRVTVLNPQGTAAVNPGRLQKGNVVVQVRRNSYLAVVRATLNSLR